MRILWSMNVKKVKYLANRFLLVLFVALVLMQMYHPAKNADPTVTKDDISKLYMVPDSVANILHKACYDCHSNNTVYPWYNNIQPVAFWLDDHINEGKHHVNFSEFGKYTLPRQARKLKKCAHEVEEGDMPMDSYQWMHKSANLTPQEKQLFEKWANELSAQIGGAAGPNT